MGDQGEGKSLSEVEGERETGNIGGLLYSTKPIGCLAAVESSRRCPEWGLKLSK